MKYVDVAERHRDFGILRILGASNIYLVGFLMQEVIAESIAGILLGFAFGYIVCGVFGLLLGGAVKMAFPFFWWPVAALTAASAPLIGAILAIPSAIRDGVKQAL